MKNSKWLCKNGFTLIEIMVAMVILLIGLLALASLLNFGFQGTKKAENKMTVINFARQKLEEIEDMNYNQIGTGNPGYKDLNYNNMKDGAETDLFGTTFVGNTPVVWSIQVQAVDDPADGLGGSDTSGTATDYKKLFISLNWTDPKSGSQSNTLQTYVGPRLLAGSDNVGPSFVCQVTPGITGVGTVTINVSASEKLAGIPDLVFLPEGASSPITAHLSQAPDYNEATGNYTYVDSTITIIQGSPPDGTAVITVTGVDLTGNPGSSTATFVIDTTPPVVVPPPVLVTSMPVEAGNSVVISVVMTDSLSVVSPLLWYQSGSLISVALTMISGSSTNGTWEGTIPASNVLDIDPYDSTNEIQYYFVARDGAGNLGTSPKYYFGVKDTTPPVITTTPVTSVIESTAVTISAQITDFMGVTTSGLSPYVKFRDVAGNYNSTIQMALFSGTAANGTWQMTIPAQVIRDWSSTSAYDVDYNISAWDSASNSTTVPGTGIYYQITVIGSDTTPPTLSSLKPAGGATNVPLDTTVSGIFSEAMIESTVTNSSNVKLLTGGVNVVPATVTYNPVNYTFTLTPTSALSYQTTYTAVVTTGVKDLAGNAMAAQQSWIFTTINSPSSRFYLHYESASGYRNLSTSAPDHSGEITIPGANGDKVVGDWLSDTTIVNPSGVWTFNVLARCEHNQIEGLFYAEVYTYSMGSPALIWTTLKDNENTKNYVSNSDYHGYSWSENFTYGAVNDKIIVRIKLYISPGKSGKNVYFRHDNSANDSTSVFVTFSP